jgi:hypothetical protein
LVEGGGEDPAAGVVEAAAAGERPLRFIGERAAAMGVAGDHVDVVDPQSHRHLDRGVDAAAEDRRRGDVGLEIGAEERVEAADRGGEAGAGGPVAEA